jgi:hypothetical protein
LIDNEEINEISRGRHAARPHRLSREVLEARINGDSALGDAVNAHASAIVVFVPMMKFPESR